MVIEALELVIFSPGQDPAYGLHLLGEAHFLHSPVSGGSEVVSQKAWENF